MTTCRRPLSQVSGSFLAVWDGATGEARALQRQSVGGTVAAAGVGVLGESVATDFVGLFPSAKLSVDGGANPAPFYPGS